jgi:hypothetical protein
MPPGRTASPSAAARRRRGRSLNSRVLQLAALGLSFIGISILVVTSSRAAFVAQSENVTNQVTSASVDLTDTDSGTALFTGIPALTPGTTVDRCIDVTYGGTVDPTAVVLYAAGAPTGDLAPYLNLTVEVGHDTPAAFRDCTGFVATGGPLWTGTLASFAATRTAYGTGVTAWDPSGPDTRTFRFRISVQDDAAAEAKTSTFGFTWETRSN